MLIDIITGKPGVGKTDHVIEEIIGAQGKYVIACPKIKLLDEVKTRIEANAAHKGVRGPEIALIHAQNNNRKLSVIQRIEGTPTDYRKIDHVVALITHEGMMSADMSRFQGWSIFIDEVPNSIQSGILKGPALAYFMDVAYSLSPHPYEAGWSQVSAKEDGPRPGSVQRDPMLSGLTEFDKRVRGSGSVYVKGASWDEFKDVNKPIHWCALWTPQSLDAFSSVTFVGANYMNSLGYMAARMSDCADVQWNERRIESPPRAQMPSVTIRYFAGAHRGSTEYWSKDEGKACLLRVRDYLSQIPDLGYWSGNDMVQKLFEGHLPGEMVAPKQEGINALRHHTSCAYIYSAKANPSDQILLPLFDIERADVERARETEDIIQFVLRGSLRCNDFGGEYTVYLYERQQAEALAEYLQQEEIASVRLEPIEEAGLLDHKRTDERRREVVEDEQKKSMRRAERQKRDAERKRTKRTKEAEKRKATNTYRGRGRPKKAA
jgi:hypothetical protein